MHWRDACPEAYKGRQKRTTYKDPNGVTRTWESAERRTRPKDSDIDGVGIVAILEKETGRSHPPPSHALPTRALTFCLVWVPGLEVVLQKQYRPPLDKVVIEIPAGLIDEGETAEQAAIRELKEETGYVGKVLEVSPVMFNGLYHIRHPFPYSPRTNCSLPIDPGFCNTNLKMVHVSVDMTLPENQDLKPELEENEFIEVFLVRLTDLWAELEKLEAAGYAIDARIANLAEGIELAKKFKL